MKYFSTHKQSPEVSFREAVIKGLAPDKGLYFPEEIPPLSSSFFENIHQKTLQEIGFAVASKFVDKEIPGNELEKIIQGTLNFPIPLVEVDEGVHSLELYHGPTCAFKDVGARFMARCLGYFNEGENQKVTVLVATSGDTGSAVANGFLGVEGVDVVILYPSGGVSEIQEKQLTTLGQNIRALEVKGSFDDCQRMVKDAFQDEDLNETMQLTSANSINIARLVPQSFYYFHALAQLGKDPGKVSICVPSGNFGNLTAGLFAKEMGLPVHQYIAATNSNHIVPDFLQTGQYKPKPSVKTLANAMDVGDPSNFARIQAIYPDLDKVRSAMVGCWYSDEEILKTIKKVKDEKGYLLDPHGAIGYRGITEYLAKEGGTGIFLETAHPAKFIDTVESVIDEKVEIPERLQAYMRKEKVAKLIEPELHALKTFLMAD